MTTPRSAEEVWDEIRRLIEKWRGGDLCGPDPVELIRAFAAQETAALREEFGRLDASHAAFVKRLVEVERERDALQRRVEALENTEEPHPWGHFLQVRMRCIAWMARNGKTDAEIAEALSMNDIVQVTLIRMTAEEAALHGGEEPQINMCQFCKHHDHLPLPCDHRQFAAPGVYDYDCRCGDSRD